jgi:Lipocalin-like domain
MKRKSAISAVFMAIILCGVSFVLLAGGSLSHAANPQDLKNKLLGTWFLVSMENDQKVQVLGEHPRGMIVFDSEGHFASQVMRSDLPKFASPDRTKATPEESQTAIRSSMALFGSYAVEGTDTLRLHIVGSLFPNWNGVDQIRIATLSNDTLELTNRTNSFGANSVHAFWKRSAGASYLNEGNNHKQ